MRYEHWLAVGWRWELVVLEFAPGRALAWGDDWRANVWLLWPLVRDRHDATQRAYMEHLLDLDPDTDYQPDWKRLALTIAHGAGILRVARRPASRVLVPDLRDLLDVAAME